MDHATPLLFGGDAGAFELARGRSPQLRRWRPRPQPLLPRSSRELDRPPTFVGRGHVLTRLAGPWLDDGAPAVALVQGMAGLGKTSIAAEAVHLWHGRFDGVFAFQSKPTALTFDEFLRQLDQRLALHSKPYRELCDDDPNAAVYLKPSARLTGAERFQRLRGGRTAEQVWVAFGEIYSGLFDHLMTSGEEGSRDVAVEMGRRGISYFVRAGEPERLGSFASEVVTSTRDPALLGGVIVELKRVVDQVAVGEPHWSLQTNLADALTNAGRPDASLGLYEQAASEAEEAGRFAHVGVIFGGWANALRIVGQLDAAKAAHLRSAEAYKKAGSPRANVVGRELEAFRIDVMRGTAERALPEIESRLGDVRSWWRRHRGGESVPEAPDPVFLGRLLVGALDVAEEANRALKRWQASLEIIEEIGETKKAFGEGKHEQGIDRFNQYFPLFRLGRFDEAQRVLEGCLQVFREVNDVPNQAKALSALADLWDQLGDRVQAVVLERQALAVKNRLPELSSRSISHSNLSNYLERLGKAKESALHLLTGISYSVLVGHHQQILILLENLAISMRQAADAGSRYELPRLAELLGRGEFAALREVVEASGAGVEELQARIDELVEQVRSDVESGASS